MSDGEFVRVASTADVGPGAGIKVAVGTKNVALFNVDGEFYAVQNNCPHRGAPLFCGTLGEKAVTCLDHGWKFSLLDGATDQGPECALLCWDVRVDGENILLSRLPRLQTD